MCREILQDHSWMMHLPVSRLVMTAQETADVLEGMDNDVQNERRAYEKTI